MDYKIEVTLDGFSRLLEFAADEKSDQSAVVMCQELRGTPDTPLKRTLLLALVVPLLGVEVEDIASPFND